MENLAEKWQHLMLMEEEDEAIIVDEQRLAKDSKNGDLSLVGKLHADRPISKKVIRNTMRKVWITIQPFTFSDISQNLFNVAFENQEDKDRVIRGRPWLFNSYLFALKLFDKCTPLFNKEQF